jgi:hypothetical protein
MSNDHREERKQLKQKLFHIRRFVGGEPVKLDTELRELRKSYEALPNFTTWADFPERWDIGDPNGVKDTAFSFDETVARNYKKARGKGYDVIILLDKPDSPGTVLDEWYQLVVPVVPEAKRIQSTESERYNLRGGHIEVPCDAYTVEMHYITPSRATIQVSGPKKKSKATEKLNKLDSFDILTALSNDTATALRDLLVGASIITTST